VKSTSVHSLNADKRLTRTQRYLWLAANRLNNSFLPNAAGHGLAIIDFAADVAEDYWSRTAIKSSPSRKLSDLFWLQIPWEAIEAELGTISVFDTGCGSGGHGERLRAYSGDRVSSYTGVDVVEHRDWATHETRHAGFHFRKMSSSEAALSIPNDTTLIISQSAIEHFEADLTYFEDIRDHISRTARPVLQIHLFPSAACLPLYAYHGVRQYTPRTVARIARVFGDQSHAVLYRLGGDACNRVHWEWIALPTLHAGGTDLRETHTFDYDVTLRRAIGADNGVPCHNASFYALVIQSDLIGQLFV
jgi:hypothetical protein